MNYLFKNNYLYKFDENIIIEKPYYANKIEVCIDEAGFNLFDKLDKSKAKVEDNLLKIGKTKIKTFEKQLPNFNYNFDNGFEINLNIIKEAIKFTDSKGLKAVLSGVYVNELGTIIATDSFKLYHYDKGKSNNGVILSKELVSEIVKYAGKRALLSFNKTNAHIYILDDDGNEIRISGRLINAQYPNVDQLIKKDYNNLIALDKNKLKNIIEIGKLVGGDAITVYINNNEITFTGDNEYTCEFNSKNLNVYMKLDNLVNTLNSLSKNELLINYTENIKPLAFYEDNKTIIVLPMRKVE